MARLKAGFAETDGLQIEELGNVSIIVRIVGPGKELTIIARHPRRLLQSIGLAFFRGRSLDMEPTGEGDLILTTFPSDIETSSIIRSPLLVPLDIRVGDKLLVGSPSRPERKTKSPPIYFNRVIRNSRDFIRG